MSVFVSTQNVAAHKHFNLWTQWTWRYTWESCLCWKAISPQPQTSDIWECEEDIIHDRSLPCMAGPIWTLKNKKEKMFTAHLLNVSLFQAVAVRQIIELIAVLFTVINPHRDCVYDVDPAHWWCGAFSCPDLKFIWQTVYLFSELHRGLLQRWEQAPPF